MTDWIGDIFTSDVGWSHLERLADGPPRLAGTDGERVAAEATRDALAEAGARDARLSTFELQGWERGDAAVVSDDRSHAAIGLPRSPSAAATGTLVDLGHGLPADFEADLDGAVVLVDSTVPGYVDRSIHRREKYYRAVDAGASAFVFRNHVEGSLAPTGSIGTDDEPIGPIPAVGVSAEVGRRLARNHAGDPVTVSVETTVGETESANVHAEVGPDTEEAVWVTSHVDAHDISEGAADNGTGTAMLVELARTLSARHEDLDTRVRFCAFGAEEVGLRGSAHAAATTDLDAVKTVCNLDVIVRSRTLSCYTNEFDELAAATERVADRFDHPIETVPKVSTHSDHWRFTQEGVPTYHVYSESDDGDRGWAHTTADTLDKLDVRTFREQAVLLTELVVELADAGFTVDHVPRERVAEALERDGQAEGMRITDDWPYGE